MQNEPGKSKTSTNELIRGGDHYNNQPGCINRIDVRLLKLWENREILSASKSRHPYLFVIIKPTALNYIEKAKQATLYLEDYKVDFGEISLHPEECQISAVQKIQQIIVELPPQVKLICKVFKKTIKNLNKFRHYGNFPSKLLRRSSCIKLAICYVPVINLCKLFVPVPIFLLILLCKLLPLFN